MDFIINFDWAVFGFFEKLWNPVLDVIMSVITYLGTAGVVWIVIALCLLIPEKTRKIGIYVGVSLALTFILNESVIKEIVQRPRPYDYTGWPEAFNYPDLVSKLSSWSFPSGHAATAFASAFPILLKSKKKYGIPAIVLATLIALSRIYVHVHYPTDVLAGAALGIIISILVILFIDKLVCGKIIPAIKKKKVE